MVLHLKKDQLDAMSSSDEFVPVLPAFETYGTCLSYGRDPLQVSTEVLDIKFTPIDTKLLSKFFTQLASETNNNQCDGIFIPKGAAYLLGLQTYKQILQENNFFLTTVTTIPVNLAYDTWFAVIDPNQSADTDEPISLYDHLVCKPWFLWIESVAKEKCLLITTKPNLPEAHAWIDVSLEQMIRKLIPPGIDPPSSLLPCHLNKPIPSMSSQSYADILKKQFSLSLPSTPLDASNNQPPRKRQAAIIDYDSDHGMGSLATTVASTATNNSCKLATPSASTITVDYAAELQLIKTELASLCTLITSAVNQMKTATESLKTSHPSPAWAMEIEADKPIAANHPSHLPTELHDIVTDLKYKIATIVIEMCALFEKSQTSKMTTHQPPPPAT